MSIAAPPLVRPPAPAISPDEAIREVEENLLETRRRIIRQRIATGAVRLFAIGAIALGLIAALDYTLELAAAWRGLALLSIVGGAIAFAVTGWRKWVSSYTLPAAAKDAERRAAEFGQRLRTTLDYEYDVEAPRPAEASRGLLHALHAETHQVSRRTNWDALVDGRPLLKALVLAAACFVVWVIALVASSEFRLAAGRSLMLPLQYTTVTFTPQSSTIKYGESVTVQAEVSGRPIAAASLRHRKAGSSDEWTTLELVAEEPVEVDGKLRLHGALAATLAKLQQDQEFEVLAGPTELPLGSIRVLQPLKLVGVTAHVIPPAYTGRQPETVHGLNLKVLEGSNVELTILLSRPAAEGQLTAVANKDNAAAASIPLTSDCSKLQATLTDLRKNATYTIVAKAEDGIALDPRRLAIKVQLDRPPSVQFIEPQEELSVIPTAEVRMVAEAKDDLGLHQTGILYQIGSGPMIPLWTANSEGSTEPERSEPVLMLENHELTFQDAITYHAFAEDNYFGQPRRVTTPLRFVDIRPFKQQFQVVNSNCNCQGQSATLEELIKRQREQLTAAFAAQQQQGTANPELLKRLAAGEADLLAKTEEFWQGIEAIAGPIPTLQEAVEQMQDAVTALGGQMLPEGVSAEQQALAALVKARENLRQKLNQSSCASQCQKFDREQQQKLRMPEKKEQDQQQRVAQARKKLNDLAQKEREWAQQCKNCQNPSSSKSSQSKPSASSSSSASSQSSGQPMPMPSQGQPMPMPGEDQPMPMPGSEQAGEKSPNESPSPEALAKAQEQLLNELKKLQEQLAQAGQQSQAGQKQAEQAAASMKEGLDELKKQNGENASEAGERSADQLERLAEHLAAMNAKDLGERLAQAQQLAQQLAAGQEAVEKKLGEGKKSEGEKPAGENGQGEKSPSGQSGSEQQEGSQPGGEEPGDNPGSGKSLSAKERQLAAEAKLLAEQLAALERDAASEPGNLGQQLAQAAAENPPEEIAAAIEQAANDLEENRPGEARRGVAQTREQLQELGKQLGAARGEFSQPQLEELQKLEEQLAQLMERAERAKQAGTKPSPADQAKWQELLAKLESMAGGDKRLTEALAKLRAGEHRQNGQPLPPGVYPEIELIEAPNTREIAKALQSKIQEAILASALMDADQPVPPQYRELVEKYYRALSDDLR